jgi:hypothetical protein
MSKKKKPAGKKPISDKERARRQAAAMAALGNDGTTPQKTAGHDHHSTMAKARIIRHQGR